MISITVIDASGSWVEYKWNQPGSSISIGRNSDCSIVLRDDVVSGRHGELLFEGSRICYRDLNSANGTVIAADGRQKKLFRNPVMVELPGLCVLKIGSTENISRQILLLIQTNPGQSPWSIYPLTDEPVSIGTGPENGISLPYTYGGIQASIRMSAEQCLIRTNGRTRLQVNGGLRGVEAILDDNDLIELGGQVMIYSRKRLLFRSDSAGLPLNGIHITKLVRDRAGRQKKILDDVSVSIKPNQFTAIVGGSGAGKTTLMNALSGFEPEYSGDSQTGGLSLKENFDTAKHLIGFVPQQDILYENLTLKKMLNNAAKLRMDPGTSSAQRKQRVRDVLGMADLLEHENTVISKLSGGQKKRASIAVELLADPKLFFLDEPSSGLDPGTEKSLMIMLNHLARNQKKTIVMVTHNIANLDLCDQVIFMERGGRLAFAGTSEEARKYFNTEDLTDVYLSLNEDAGGQWARRFRAVQPEIEPAPDAAVSIPKAHRDSVLRQLGIFLDRYISVLIKDPKRLLMLLVQPLLIALLLAVVSSEDTFLVFNATQSMMFSLSCSAIWIGLFNTIQEICKERVIVKREYMSRLKLLPYLMAKFLISMVLGLIQAAILGGVYLATQSSLPEGLILENSAPEIIFTLWLTIMAAESLGFVVSSLARTGDKAMTYAPFLLIVQLIFSGILFKLKGIGEMISNLTISKWSVQALGVITDLNALPTSFENEFPNLEISREVNEIYTHSLSNLQEDWLVLILMTVVCLAMTLLLLTRIKKDRR